MEKTPFFSFSAGFTPRSVSLTKGEFSFALASSALLFFLFLILAGCSLTKGDKEISSDLAGPVDDFGLSKATKKLIVKINNMEFLRKDRRENPDCLICFLGIQNLQGEDVPGLTSAVKRQFREMTSYQFVEESAIAQAVEKGEVKRNDLFIPDKREKFLTALDQPVQYVLSGHVVSSPVTEVEPGQLAGDNIVFDLVSVHDDGKAIIQDRMASVYNIQPRKKVMGLF